MIEEGVDPASQVSTPTGIDPEAADKSFKVGYAKGAEKARRELEAQYAAEIERIKGNAPVQDASPSLDPQVVQKLVQEQIQAMQQQYAEQSKAEQEAAAAEEHRQAMAEVAKKYLEKTAQAKEAYPDFEEKMADFDYGRFAPIVAMAADSDHTPDIMYELATNPEKLATLNMIAKENPKGLPMAMKKLADSIARNKEAAQTMRPGNAPLSQLKSANVGMDTSKMTVRDFKNMDYIKRAQ